MRIAARFDNIRGSETVAISNRAAELRRQGHDVISFAAGEPDFATPPHVVEAMARAARDGATRYPPSLGLPRLREAVAAHATRRYEVELGADRVAVTPGAKWALWAAFQSLVDPGDEVLVPTPCWVSYGPLIALAQGVMVPVATRPERGFRIDAASLRAAITPRTVGIALNLPNNPTGALAAHDELAAIADLAIEHDLWLVVDDIYAELRFTEGPFPSPLRARPELRDRTVIVDGPSKSHAMTGWRLGYAVAPPKVMKGLSTLIGQVVTGVTTFAQHGAIAALEGDMGFLEGWRSTYRRRRDRVLERARACGLGVHEPEGAFYALLGIGSKPELGADDADFCRALLDQEQVALVPGSAFAAPGFVRLSFACEDESLERGLDRLGRFVSAAR